MLASRRIAAAGRDRAERGDFQFVVSFRNVGSILLRDEEMVAGSPCLTEPEKFGSSGLACEKRAEMVAIHRFCQVIIEPGDSGLLDI